MADHLYLEVGRYLTEAGAILCRDMLREQSRLARLEGDVVAFQEGPAWVVLLRLSERCTARLVRACRTAGGMPGRFADLVQLAHASALLGPVEDLFVAELGSTISVVPISRPDEAKRRGFDAELQKLPSSWDGSAGRRACELEEMVWPPAADSAAGPQTGDDDGEEQP